MNGFPAVKVNCCKLKIASLFNKVFFPASILVVLKLKIEFAKLNKVVKIYCLIGVNSDKLDIISMFYATCNNNLGFQLLEGITRECHLQ